jgi:hypothetical protein
MQLGRTCYPAAKTSVCHLLSFFFLNHVYMKRKIFVFVFFFFFICVYVYVFAFYIFDKIFMRKNKFFGLYFEIFE